MRPDRLTHDPLLTHDLARDLHAFGTSPGVSIRMAKGKVSGRTYRASASSSSSKVEAISSVIGELPAGRDCSRQTHATA